MFNVINSSKMNSLKIIQEFKDAGRYSRTTSCFSRIKDVISFDSKYSKFKDNSWRSRTSGNLGFRTVVIRCLDNCILTCFCPNFVAHSKTALWSQLEKHCTRAKFP